RQFVEFDDGGGPALYIAGDFTTVGDMTAKRIVRFDGREWTNLRFNDEYGFNSRVDGVLVHDDGNGLAMFVAGQFTQAFGISVGRVARWDGNTWTPVGSGTSARIR